MELNWEQLRELISALDQTDISEFNLEFGELKLNIRKRETAPASEPASEPIAAIAPTPSPTPPRKTVDIVSPMVGTFYRAPAPDEPPYVEVGDMVKKGDIVCIVEAMKVMNHVEAEVSGRVVEILVENAQPVEFEQALMRIEV
ncbi:MAG: acetyl-CoA carboxylase biotin carboxyl carrier protein [Pseudanabaenaceae cyanobacterium]